MQQSIRFIQQQLNTYYPEPEINSFVYWILESVSGISRQSVLLGKDKQLSTNEKARIQSIVADLQKYKPIQYILGETEFFGLNFRVDEHVLIPRPETEELVEWIINDRYTHSLADPVILDIGTGSACIAVSLAKALPKARIFALDISEDALVLARENARNNGVSVEFIQHDVLKEKASNELPDRIDIMVSNPPYVTPSEKETMEANVLEYEPHLALFVPEDDPLLFYRHIARIGHKHLPAGGRLYFETSSLYGKDTARMLEAEGYNRVTLRPDISGRDRMIQASL